MSLKKGISQEKGKCKHCHESGGMHEASCPYVMGYFDASENAFKRRRSFNTIFLEMLINTFLVMLWVLIFALVVFTPLVLVDFGVIQSFIGKAIVTVWAVIWSTVAIVALVSWSSYEDQDKPERPSSYYY